MKLNTLIVDDEQELRKSVASILLNSMPDVTFNITEAANGREAVELAKKEFWDLILMDVRMPEIDGLEAYVKSKKLIHAHLW